MTALDEIKDAIRSSGDTSANENEEEVAQVATKQVLTITRRYAELIKPDLKRHRKQLRDLIAIGDKFDNSNLLSEQQRETLVLGHFLWEQLEATHTGNYAGAALLFSGVLEQLARETFYKHSPLVNPSHHPYLDPTQRTLGRIKHNRHYIEPAIKTRHWQVPDNNVPDLATWIDKSADLSKLRNDVAHEAVLSETKFNTFKNLYFGGIGIGYGLLASLILAWR